MTLELVITYEEYDVRLVQHVHITYRLLKYVCLKKKYNNCRL